MITEEIKKKIIVALDNPEIEASKELVSKINEKISFYKVGLGSFTKYGFELVKFLENRNKEIFLDLKLFDIDNTIETAVQALSDHNISYLTVHGDPKIIDSAVKARRNKNLKILAVTFLTNVDRKDLNNNLIKAGDLKDLVKERAEKALKAGADGIIASGQEISIIKSLKQYNKRIIVTPGIRPVGSIKNDQKRVCTPEEAIKKGASHLVIGRPIWEAKKPEIVIEKIFENIL
tara:strand:+ start:285 stop:983 length:699 start_codon:yes stop_codon:yes gene_type:complete